MDSETQKAFERLQEFIARKTSFCSRQASSNPMVRLSAAHERLQAALKGEPDPARVIGKKDGVGTDG